MTTVGIIQPNYIPWRGYFDFIRRTDAFVFLDDVQYTKRDWRNRNKIKLPNGDTHWLTVPVRAEANSKINEVEIDYSQPWVSKHLASIEHCYRKAPFFDDFYNDFKEVLQKNNQFLSDMDIELTKLICEWLGIKASLYKASEIGGDERKDFRLISITRKLGGDRYLSGPAAKAYIQSDLWSDAKIKLEYIVYPDYPVYRQISMPFIPEVSVLDLIFMTGRRAPEYIWGSASDE